MSSMGRYYSYTVDNLGLKYYLSKNRRGGKRPKYVAVIPNEARAARLGSKLMSIRMWSMHKPGAVS